MCNIIFVRLLVRFEFLCDSDPHVDAGEENYWRERADAAASTLYAADASASKLRYAAGQESRSATLATSVGAAARLSAIAAASHVACE